MKEKVKRLKVRNTTLRELYLKSGNQCAFPGCYHCIVDHDGKLVGQICHIEAANEGGERFNPYMTNEERRSYDNLMIMCYDHHIATNDVDEYSVSELKEMKKEHEKKYSSIIEDMGNSIVDYATKSDFIKTKNCLAFNDVFKWNLSLEDGEEFAEELNKLLLMLKEIPIQTRGLFAIMINRGQWHTLSCTVALHEIQLDTGMTVADFNKHLNILTKYRLVNEPYEDEGLYFCEINEICWKDILEFCKKKSIDMKESFVKLDFSIFDHLEC